MTRRRKGFILSAALAVAGCASGVLGGGAGSATAGQQGKRRPARPSAQARSDYKQHCAKCHGLDGRGRTIMGELSGAPNFTDASWQEGATDKRMNASITHGRGGMPPFKDELSAAEVSALVAYVRRFKN